MKIRTFSEPEIERQVQTEMAELCLKLGTAAAGAERAAYFKQAQELCAAVQWKGTDMYFGQTVVILAHLQLVEGKNDAARKVIAVGESKPEPVLPPAELAAWTGLASIALNLDETLSNE